MDIPAADAQGHSTAVTITEEGVVLGNSGGAFGGFGHAFFWTPDGGMTLIIPVSESLRSDAVGMSADGMIAGFAFGGGGSRFTGFLYTADGEILWPEDPVAGYSYTLSDINAAGVSTVYSGTDSGVRSFTYIHGSGYTDIGDLGGDHTYALAINNAGVVAGTSQNEEGNDRVFRYDAESGMHDLGVSPGSAGTQVNAINEHGWVLGMTTDAVDDFAYIRRPFIAKPDGTIVTIAAENAEPLWVSDLNDHGWVVGSYQTANRESRAFVYIDGAIIDLNHLVAEALSDGSTPGFVTLDEAVGINNRGQVVGTGTYLLGPDAEGAQREVDRVFVLTLFTGSPGPFPSAEPRADGWLLSDWFGWFRDGDLPWIYTLDHGWLYVTGDEATGLWLYDPYLGAWWWAINDSYPYLYLSGEHASWMRYVEESGISEEMGPAGRWFYHYNIDDWVRADAF